MAAFWRIHSMRQKELHQAEMPQAVNTAMLANVNRDSKSRKKPFEASDFFCYQPFEEQDRPHDRYANCFMKMITDGSLPSWALFVFGSMKGGEADNAPAVYALTAPGIILLGPVWGDGIISGMLIAQERKKGPVELQDPSGNTYMCVVDEIDTKIRAIEDADVRILQ